MPKSTHRNSYLSMPIAIVTAFAVVSTSLLAYTQLSPLLSGAAVVPPTCTIDLDYQRRLLIVGDNPDPNGLPPSTIFLYESRTGVRGSWRIVRREESDHLNYQGLPGYYYSAYCRITDVIGATSSQVRVPPLTADFSLQGISMSPNRQTVIVDIKNVGDIPAVQAAGTPQMSIVVKYKDPSNATRFLEVQKAFDYGSIQPGAVSTRIEVNLLAPVPVDIPSLTDVTVTVNSARIAVETNFINNTLNRSVVEIPRISSSSQGSAGTSSSSPIGGSSSAATSQGSAGTSSSSCSVYVKQCHIFTNGRCVPLMITNVDPAWRCELIVGLYTSGMCTPPSTSSAR